MIIASRSIREVVGEVRVWNFTRVAEPRPRTDDCPEIDHVLRSDEASSQFRLRIIEKHTFAYEVGYGPLFVVFTGVYAPKGPPKDVHVPVLREILFRLTPMNKVGNIPMLRSMHR